MGQCPLTTPAPDHIPRKVFKVKAAEIDEVHTFPAAQLRKLPTGELLSGTGMGRPSRWTKVSRSHKHESGDAESKFHDAIDWYRIYHHPRSLNMPKVLDRMGLKLDSTQGPCY